MKVTVVSETPCYPPMAGNRIYAFAGTHSGVDSLDHFKDWPEPVSAMVAAADPQRVLKNELL